MRNFYFLILILFLLQKNSFAQSGNMDSRFSVFGNYNYNIHLADFGNLPGIPNCCPKFEKGFGSGFSPGLGYGIYLLDYLDVNLKAGYSEISAKLTSTEPVDIMVSGISTPGEFSYILDASLSQIEIQPGFSLSITQKFKLNANVNLGYMLKKDFYQREEITKPTDVGTFMDSNGQDSKSRIRHEFQREIPDYVPIQVGIGIGLSYDLPLNSKRTFFLIPEIKGYYSFSPIVKNYKWSAHSIRAGLSFAYSTVPYIDTTIIPEENIQEILAYEQALEAIGDSYDLIYGTFEINDKEKESIDAGITAQVRAVGVTDKEENPELYLQIEEFMSTNMTPLLNYIFFDDNSAQIPKRYRLHSKEEIKNLTKPKLYQGSTLDLYYNILNIIGMRLSNYPNARITIMGCNSDIGKEKGNKALSKQRAEAIADYFKNVWNINPSRIEMKYQNLPNNFSNKTREDGIVENRRVEITSNNWEILEPVIVEDTLLKASPQSIRFYPEVFSLNEIESWKLSINQDSKEMTNFLGQSSIPKVLDWNLRWFIDALSTEPINYNLEIANIKGSNYQTEQKNFPVEHLTIKKKRENRLGDKKIDHYSLILFDYNSAEFSSQNIRIADFIKNRIESNSRVLITGYTDAFGDEEYNRKLSEDRAKNLSELIGDKKAFVRGIGETEDMFDNKLPEGRFYSRTVDVEVETPIKW
ncbi:MAG: hypothetical protein A2X63_09445 [Ignavibacteria bacterium GWA2_35_8]|nr:MAG: hypothetical protein A2X63_09445 [Ignavibacteria bacterium GWA2_35_8]